MATWEWIPSGSATIDIILSPVATDADGTCEADITYLPSKSVKAAYTLTAKYLTDAESATEKAKLGTSQTFTDHRGNSIAGIVAGHSEQPANSTGRVHVTLQLITPWQPA
ncbi:MAG: hypothetical protein AB2L14_25275 [Candidatus Xenobiia bacterium LiM19]